MRGTKTFEAVFNTSEDTGRRKGRSSKLLEQRNKCIADRYYYYGNFSQKRYDAIIRQLSAEFFLSVVTIPDIIDQNMDRLEELKRTKPTPAQFAKLWPFLKW